MAPVPLKNIKPKDRISLATTPPALKEALIHIFQNAGPGLWLVGGTALAGYYAEHRRSDDLDLFAITPEAHRAAILAVKSLQKMGAVFSNERNSPYYYHADSRWKNHPFTIDVVLDENIGLTGAAITTGEGVVVADLPTLFSQKAACLISRASEKDLFDLDWMFEKRGRIDVDEILQAGVQIDGGMNVEALLISLQGSVLRKEACHFLLPQSKMTPEQAYKKIEKLKKKIIALLLEYEKKQPLSPEIKALSAAIKKPKKSSR